MVRCDYCRQNIKDGTHCKYCGAPPGEDYSDGWDRVRLATRSSGLYMGAVMDEMHRQQVSQQKVYEQLLMSKAIAEASAPMYIDDEYRATQAWLNEEVNKVGAPPGDDWYDAYIDSQPWSSGETLLTDEFPPNPIHESKWNWVNVIATIIFWVWIAYKLFYWLGVM